MKSPATRNTDALTPSQRQAVAARGNVLVMAGAGTGKTHTLVERCLDCLCRERASLDEILVVTFTEAAATEMKQRLRAALEKTFNIQHSTFNQHLAEQLALFDTAAIGTLHGFCLRLVREHFYELGLDPQLAVLDPGEARLLAEETLDEQFQAHYAGQTDFSVATQNLIQIYGNGDDRPIRAMLLQLHHYAQTRPDADRWLAEQFTRFASPEPVEWREWLNDAIAHWREEWLPVLKHLGAPASGPVQSLEHAGSETGAPPANEKAAELAAILSYPGNFDDSQTAGEKNQTPGSASVPPASSLFTKRRQDAGAPGVSRESAAAVLGKTLAADENYPKGRKGVVRKPLEHFFADAAFLQSLMPTEGSREPLAEDWDWIRGHMTALLQLAQEFGQKFAERKRADGVLDFQDLEQFALKLLWDSTNNQPTAVAERWRQKIRFVFVDEYQDINTAQDKIIQALSRDEGWGETTGEPSNMAGLESDDGSRGNSPHRANRFLVGDVKQSIYRFRLADPKIFREYAQSWRGENGQVIPLTENFRSRESLLGFVNSVFELLLREDVGGVKYDTEARLQFGAPEQRTALSLARNPAPRAELLIRFNGDRDDSPADGDFGDNDLAELEEVEKEARLVAHRLRELAGQGHTIWDAEKRAERAVGWRDMAVLLRAPANKAEAYAKEFERAGVPLVVKRGGFYDSTEIADLLSLLRLLDNPLQDVPAIAVLRSPLVGLSLDELATVRLAAKDVHFWTAVNRRQEAEGRGQKGLCRKIDKFLERFSRWRMRARQASLSQCLECVLAETHYAEWLRSRPRGAQRQANVERFLGLAQQFDQFQRQGLFRFLKFIEAQQAADAEPEVAAVAEENAVRLMSIHQSKGLEFPVVVVADLAKPFNEQDLRREIIFDEQFGLCPRVKPPHTGRRYPSLPYWLAQRHQRREQRGEELRLLYVAMTRARDTLILTATVSENKWETLWLKPEAITTPTIVAARSHADWFGIWFGVHSPHPTAQTMTGGELPYLRWRIVADKEFGDDSTRRSRGGEAQIKDPSAAPHVVSCRNTFALDAATAKRLRAILSWEYPFDAATRRAAKSSVTALRRQAEELDDEAEPMFQTSSRFVEKLPRQRHPRLRSNPQLSAAATGTAHHTFLQHMSLEKADDPAALKMEAKRLETVGVLTMDECAALDLEAVAAFWKSEPGRKIRTRKPDCLKRELPFTAKFSPAEVDAIIGAKTPPGLEDEFVVVQGVADLVALLPGEIWLVDFKTDEIKPEELAERRRLYEPQLKLYAKALSRIYSRPVTNCWLHFLTARKTIII
ncbi:MAG TPA: UvrD-helicase domain-containing protein [Candidatus Limnocylindrales bacterium]|nr:UvrD-helicase domain-containing protein [Candidatus Limnocylindrales bacterium]